MTFKTLPPRLITSPHLRHLQRTLAGARRTLLGRKPVVRFFHQVDDPHSALAARALTHLEDSYGVSVAPFLVSPPSAAAAPDPERLGAWRLGDAALLAQGLGLEPTFQTPPSSDDIAAAEAALAGCTSADSFTRTSAAIEAAWRRDQRVSRSDMPTATGAGAPARARGDVLRQRLGHYLGGVFHFEGEWYWGLDRLAFLEQRLAPRNPGATPFVARLDVKGIRATAPPGRRIEAFVSLRSPYTYIAVPRLVALARASGIALDLRPVLPMVMRGLPVPLEKRLYIIRDAHREAERLGLRFGAIVDPVGKPAERGLAVLCAAIAEGRGEAFLLSFLQGVFADGIDAGTEPGLATICARADISARAMHAALADTSWREKTEANRNDMLAAGVWGAPSFRVMTDGVPKDAVWGQDRLWAVERALYAAATSEP